MTTSNTNTTTKLITTLTILFMVGFSAAMSGGSADSLDIASGTQAQQVTFTLESGTDYQGDGTGTSTTTYTVSDADGSLTLSDTSATLVSASDGTDNLESAITVSDPDSTTVQVDLSEDSTNVSTSQTITVTVEAQVDASTATVADGVSYTVNSDGGSLTDGGATETSPSFDITNSNNPSYSAASTPNDITVQSTTTTQDLAGTGSIDVDVANEGQTGVTLYADLSPLTNNGVDISGATVGTTGITNGVVASSNVDTSNNELVLTVDTDANQNSFSITQLQLTGLDTSSATATTGLTYGLGFSSNTYGATSTNSFAIQAGTPSNVLLSSSPQDETVTADGTSTITYTATVEDIAGNKLEGVSVQGDATSGSNILFDGNSASTNTKSTTSGTVDFTVSSTDSQSNVAISFTEQTNSNSASGSATFEAGPATNLAITNDPGTITAGDTFDVTVQATDANSNPAAGQDLSNFDLSHGTDGSLTASDSLSLDGDGKATVSVPADTAITAESGYTLSATSDETGSTTQDITVNPDSHDGYLVEPASTTQTAGTSFNVDIKAVDQYDNVVTSIDNTLDGYGYTFSGPSDAPDGTTPTYPSTPNFNSGVWSTSATTLVNAESTTISIEDSQSTPATGTSNSITVDDSGTSSYGFTSEPSYPLTAGSSVTFSLEATDQYGNIDSDYTSTASITTTGNADVSTTQDFTSGTLDFTTSNIQTATTGQSLQVEQNSGSSFTVSSTSFEVNPASASKIVIKSSQLSLTAGNQGTMTAEIQDTYGNPVTSGSYTLGLSTDSGTGEFRSVGGSTALSSAEVSVGDGSSQANFDYYDETSGSPTVTVSEGSLTDATQGQTISPASADSVSISNPQSDLIVKSAESIDFGASATDQYGNTLDSLSDTDFTWNTGTDASVDSSGVFSSSTSGTYDVSAERNGATDTVSVTVDTTSPSLDSAKTTSKTTINVTLSDATSGIDAATIETGDFNVASNTVTGVDTSNVDGSTGSQTVELTLGSQIATDATPDVSLTGTGSTTGIQDIAGNQATTGTVTPTDGANPVIELNSGLNLVSFPISSSEDLVVSDVLDESKTNEVWKYTGGDWKVWTPSKAGSIDFDIRAGEGYVVNSSSSYTHTPEIDELTGSIPREVDVVEGWNLVGHYDESSQGIDTSTGTLATVGMANVNQVWENTGSGSINYADMDTGADSFMSGQAYWVQTKGDLSDGTVVYGVN